MRGNEMRRSEAQALVIDLGAFAVELEIGDGQRGGVRFLPFDERVLDGSRLGGFFELDGQRETKRRLGKSMQ